MNKYAEKSVIVFIGLLILALLQAATGEFTIGKMGAGFTVSKDTSPGFFWGIMATYLFFGFLYIAYNLYQLMKVRRSESVRNEKI